MSCVYQALFSPHQPDIIASCSTDGTLKIFDLRSPAYTQGPNANAFTNPLSAAALTVPASGTELLSIDWNKYRPFVLASAGVDKMIRVWDCRMVKSNPDPNQQAVGGVCETQFVGHEYAVRRVQWSPHHPDLLASASYDMTCRVYVVLSLYVRPEIFETDNEMYRWSTTPSPNGTNLVYIHDSHTEFVVGCAWSLYEEGVLASCSWDCRVNVFHI